MTTPSLTELKNQATWQKHTGNLADALTTRLILEQRYVDEDASIEDQACNLNMIAFLCAEIGDLRGAERAARRCLDLYRPIARDDDGVLATYLMMLASVLAEAGNFDEALSHGEAAVRLYAASGHNPEYVADRQRNVERIRNRETQLYLDRE